jgi:hypothetical protein
MAVQCRCSAFATLGMIYIASLTIFLVDGPQSLSRARLGRYGAYPYYRLHSGIYTNHQHAFAPDFGGILILLNTSVLRPGYQNAKASQCFSL